MSRLAAIALAAALAFSSGPGAAQSDADKPSVALADMLKSLSAELGVSFVFDSRVVRRARVAPLASAEDFPGGLALRLEAIGLQIRQMGDGTFVIAPIRQQPEERPEAAGLAREARPPLDIVVVTAAAAARFEPPGADHIYSIDSDQLSLLNVNATADAVYELPSALASFSRANTALLGALSGIDLADLRGLSPARTAVRVNGRRRTLAPGGNGEIAGVDLNSLPEAFLERIEVHAATALARHGAGAAAGVINFVTKSDVNGLNLRADAGLSERGDSERLFISAIGGLDLFGGAGNMTMGAAIARNEGLLGADREATSPLYGFARNGRVAGPGAEFLPGFGGSSATAAGLVSAAILDDGRAALFPGRIRYIPTGSGLTPFVGALDQLYDAAAEISAVIPSNQVHGFATAAFELSDRLKVQVSAFGGAVANDITLAPLPGTRAQGIDPLIGDAIAIDLANPIVPAAVRQAVEAAFGPSARSLVLERRYVELGPRRQKVDRSYVDLAASLTRALGDAAEIEVSYRYGRTGVSSVERNRVDRDRLLTALDPALCTADPRCAPANPFAPEGVSDAAADYIRAPALRRQVSIEDHDVGVMFRRSIGDDGEAFVGAELRSSRLADRSHRPAGLVAIGTFGSMDTRAALRSGDILAGADFQALRFRPDSGGLRLSLAGRLSASKTFGLAPSMDGAVTIEPAAGVALFTRQSRGRRTPNVVELFTRGDQVSMSFVDPCAAPSAGSTIAANCASAGPLGVPPGFVQTALDVSRTFYGNPELEAERVESQSYGVDLAPTDWFSFIPGRMKFAAAWTDLRIRDQINFEEDALFACYSSPALSHPACGLNPATGRPVIFRDAATGQIASYDTVGVTGGALEWRGLDLEFRYVLEPMGDTPIDRLWVSALHTWTNRVRETSPDGAATRLDGLQDYPKHRTQALIGGEIGPVELVASIVRRGAAVTERLDIPETRLPPAVYVDAAARIALADNVRLQFGVENIADRDPPIVAYSAGGGNTPKQHYDIVGRRYMIGVRAEF